jgi:hypothetical protein
VKKLGETKKEKTLRLYKIVKNRKKTTECINKKPKKLIEFTKKKRNHNKRKIYRVHK